MSVEFSITPRAHDAGHAEFDVAVPENLRYLEGHFQGAPIVPAVAIVECLARRLTQQCWPELEHLRQVRQLKFRQPVLPGDQLRLVLRLDAPRHVSFRLESSDEIRSSGTLCFAGASS